MDLGIRMEENMVVKIPVGRQVEKGGVERGESRKSLALDSEAVFEF